MVSPKQIGVGLICLIFSLCSRLLSGDYPQVQQYSPYDIHLTGSAVDNPYKTHRLWAEWHGPNGKSLQTEGFWNGGIDWIIRVALTEAGLWNYTTHATDPLLDQCTGTLECFVSQSRGFVKQNGRHFYYQDGTPPFLYNEIMSDRSYGLPMCNDEFGYEGPTDPSHPYYHKTNQSGRYAKEDAWTMLCAGAYFIWGNVFTFTGKEYIINTDSLYTDGARYMSILSNFMRSGVNFTEMEPAQGYIRAGDAYCLAKHESEYLFYFPKSTTIQINLQAPHHVDESTWLDPVTGETFEDAIVYGDRIQSKTSPFADDAVLHLHSPYSEALGIGLSYFNVAPEGNSVLLEWKTESEENHAGFIIERSESL